MKNGFAIEEKELSCILINLITVKMLFSFPRTLVLNSGNSAWIQTAFVSLISCLVFWFIIFLYRKAEMKSIMELSNEIGGRGLKIVVGIILCASLLFNSSLTMRALPESIKTVLLPLTPMSLLILLLGVAILFGAYMGIFSIARIHAIYIPVALISLAVFLIMLFDDIDITNLFPVLGEGTYNIFVDGLSSVSIFSDVIVLFVLLPLCGNYERVKKASHKALVISSVINVLIVLFYNLIYSYPSSKEFMLPVYQMTRLIKIGDFFQRLEALFEFVWSFAVLLYSSLYLFVLCYIWKEIFDLKYYKPLVLPFTIIMCATAYLPSSTVKMAGIQNVSSLVSIPVSFILPIVIIFWYTKKKSRDTKKERERI